MAKQLWQEIPEDEMNNIKMAFQIIGAGAIFLFVLIILALVFGSNISVHHGIIIQRKIDYGITFKGGYTGDSYYFYIQGRDAVTDVSTGEWVDCSAEEYFNYKDGDDFIKHK